MQTLMIENILAAGLIFYIICVSDRPAIPMIIFAYYAMYILMDWVWINGMPLVRDADVWYLIMSSLDLVIMMACITAMYFGKSYTRTTFIYVSYVAIFHLVPDLAQANLIKTELRYVSTSAYEYIMEFAITFDILIAIIGSDNLISRRIFTRP